MGVVQSFPQLAFGKDAAFDSEMVNEFFEMKVVATGLEPTPSLAFEGACSTCSKLAFDTVDFSNLIEDPGGVSGVVVAGFGEFSPDVSEAADGDDVEVLVALDEGAVGSQPVALKVALEAGFVVFADEDAVEAVVSSATVPVVDDTVLGVMISPEVASLGFACAGFKVVDGSFVSFDVVRLAEALGDEFVERKESLREVVVPAAHEVAAQFDSVSGFEFPLFAVEGAVVAKLLGEEVGSEAGGEDAAG